MATKAINKDSIKKSVAKMVSDKEVVRLYMKGKIDKETLLEKGIKIGKPL